MREEEGEGFAEVMKAPIGEGLVDEFDEDEGECAGESVFGDGGDDFA